MDLDNENYNELDLDSQNYGPVNLLSTENFGALHVDY